MDETTKIKSSKKALAKIEEFKKTLFKNISDDTKMNICCNYKKGFKVENGKFRSCGNDFAPELYDLHLIKNNGKEYEEVLKIIDKNSLRLVCENPRGIYYPGEIIKTIRGDCLSEYPDKKLDTINISETIPTVITCKWARSFWYDRENFRKMISEVKQMLQTTNFNFLVFYFQDDRQQQLNNGAMWDMADELELKNHEFIKIYDYVSIEGGRDEVTIFRDLSLLAPGGKFYKRCNFDDLKQKLENIYSNIPVNIPCVDMDTVASQETYKKLKQFIKSFYDPNAVGIYVDMNRKHFFKPNSLISVRIELEIIIYKNEGNVEAEKTIFSIFGPLKVKIEIRN